MLGGEERAQEWAGKKKSPECRGWCQPPCWHHLFRGIFMRSPSLKAQKFQCKFRLCTSSRSRSVSGASAGSYAQGQRKHILRHTGLHSASSESPLPRYSNKAGMRGAPTKQHGPKTGLYLEVSFNSVCVCTCMCTCVCIYMCLWVSVSMYVHVFICICVYTYACACICGCVRVCKHMQLYVGVYMCGVRVYVCACVSGYVCMHVVCEYACVCGCDVCSYSCVCGCVHKGGVYVYMYTCVYMHVYACACVHTCRNQRRTLSPSIALHLIFESGSLIGR